MTSDLKGGGGFSPMASFSPCDALQDICLSLRPSVCYTPHQYSVEMAKHIFKLFSLSGSHTILVFPNQTLWQYYDGEPPMGVSNTGGMKKAQLSTTISVYLGNDTR